MALINARLSGRSQRRWARAQPFFKSLLDAFDVVLCQTEEGAEGFRRLGAGRADCVGNLKFSAAPLPYDQAEAAALRDRIAARPVWLAASTHPGEEEVVLAAHERLRRDHPGLLTILVPRHPSRAGDIDTMLKTRVAAVKRRTVNPAVDPADEIYIGDTLGELGLFYAIAPVAFIGGGMAALGGHNPIEPAQYGCAILYGPDRENFLSVAKQLEDAGAARIVTNAEELAAAVSMLLSDGGERGRRAEAARRVAERNRGIVDAVMERVRPVLSASAGGR